MMSNVGEDKPCIRFEGNPVEDTENKIQQETTIEAPDHQIEMQDPLSESKNKPSLDGQSSKDDEDIAVYHLSYLNVTGHTKTPTDVAGMRPQLTQPTQSAAVDKIMLKLSQKARIRSWLTQQAPFTETRMSSQITQQAESSSAAGIKSQGTYLTPSATAEMRPHISQQAADSKMKSYVAQILSAADDKFMPQLTQQAPSASTTKMSHRLSLQAASASAAETKSKSTQQASPVDEARMRSYVTEFIEASAEDMRLQLSRQAELVASARELRSQLTQKASSASAARKMSHVTQQGSSAVSRFMPQQTQSFNSGKKMQLNEQAVAKREAALLPKPTPSAVAGETDPIAQQLPTASTASAPITQQTSKAVSRRKVKLTAACLPSWENLTMVQARRGRGSRAPPPTEYSQDMGKRLRPSVRDLPEINVQNINKGITGHRFQKLLPSQARPPYRSLTERMYLERMMKVVDLTKKKKKKKKRYACDDDEDSWTTSSSSDEQKSPPKSIPSSPELLFHLEL